jgi:hypothetical protein
MKAHDRIIAMLESGMRMTRGKLCVSAVRKSGKKAYNLQYRRKTKQFVKSIPTDQVEMFRESTENCRTFLELVQQYVDDMTKRGIREIEKEAEDARRKAKASKRAHG